MNKTKHLKKLKALWAKCEKEWADLKREEARFNKISEALATYLGMDRENLSEVPSNRYGDLLIAARRQQATSSDPLDPNLRVLVKLMLRRYKALTTSRTAFQNANKTFLEACNALQVSPLEVQKEALDQFAVE
jgi:hypothetical protein